MRRWQAIPVAAFVALAVGAIMFTHTPRTEAGTATNVEFYLDCGAGLGVDCTGGSALPTGTTSLSIGIYIKNNTAGAIGLSAIGFAVEGDNQTAFTPNAPACAPPGVACNPDFNEGGVAGGFSCSPLPAPDVSASATVTESQIGCFASAAVPGTIASGATLLLATVNYTTTDGVGAFTFNSPTGTGQGGLAQDESFGELGTCNPVISEAANCFGVTVQIGASSATNTPIPTATDTPLATATNTPCVGATCPTATSVAFVTVTPTPAPATATPAGGAPPPPGESPVTGEQPGAGPGTGGAPGGDTGAGGGRPIRLPDTGSNGSSSSGSLLLAALATAAAGLLAGGAYYTVAVASDRRRLGED